MYERMKEVLRENDLARRKSNKIYFMPNYEFFLNEDSSNIKSICEKYFKWLAEKLSIKGSVSKKEVIEELENIVV